MRKVAVSLLVLLVAIMTMAAVARAKEIETMLGSEADTGVFCARFYYGGTVIVNGVPHAAAPTAAGWVNRKMWTWSAAGLNGTPHSGLNMDGWRGVDNTAAIAAYFRVASSTGIPNDNIGTCVISGNKSLFCGATTSQAATLCYVDQIGTGYGNNWSQTVVTKTYTFNVGEQIDLSYAYHNDSEPGYDFTHVILQIWDDAEWIDYDTLATFTGIVSGTEVLDVSAYMASQGPPLDTVDFRIRFTFATDGGYSDEDGTFPTACGGLEIDDYSLTINSTVDSENFESVADGGLPAGWSRLILGCGDYAHVKHVNDLPVMLNQDVCWERIGPDWCGIGDSVLVFYDENDPEYPHPLCQNNYAESPIIDFSAHPGLPGRLLQCEMFGGLSLMDDYGFMYWQVRYKPGCASGGWSPWANDNYVYYTSEGTKCRTMTFDVSGYVPPQAQQAQIGLGVINYCDEDVWGTGCDFIRNSTPYFDNVTFGIYGANVAPYISMRELDYFQDQFAEDGTLSPTSTADTRTANYQSLLVPPIFGDTMSVRGAANNTEVWLTFRMAKVAPQQPVGNAFFTTWFPTVTTGAWQSARMDTARITDDSGTGTVTVPNTYMSTFHEADAVREANGLEELTEILPNNLFVPGTRIEYFLKSQYVGSGSWYMLPDTTGGVYEEFEVLPMMRGDGAGGVEWPCLIVADHFGRRGNGSLGDYERNSNRIARHMDANDYDYDMFNKLGPTSDLRNGIGRWAANPGQLGGPGTDKYNWGPGATLAQFLAYTHCMLNAGDVYDYSMYREDVDVIQSWLTLYSDADHAKFFWLSGDQVARELYRRTTWGRFFLNNVLGAAYTNRSYAAIATGFAYCLPINYVAGGRIPTSPSQCVVRMNGCPRDFNVIAVSGGAPGAVHEREYDAQAPKRYAAVSNAVNVVGYANYRVLIEGYDNCVIRDDGSLGFPACGTDNFITTWFNAVLTWGGYGSSSICSPVTVNGIPNPAVAPAVVTSLANAYPNPMNPTATISYTVGMPGKVSLKVFDVSGRVIKTLVNEAKATGRYPVIWDGTTDRGENVASGVFFYQFEAPGYKSAKKLVILR